MKKYLFCTFAAAIAALTASGAAMAAGYGAEYGTPIIDGQKDEIWDTAQSYTTKTAAGNDGGAQADLKLMWDERFIYVYAEIKDPLLSAASADAYQQDSVELFIDENNAKTPYYETDDAQYRVNFENAASFGDGADSKNFMSAAEKMDYGYVIEVAVPFRSMVPETGTVIGFEFQVNDDSDGSGVRSSVAKLNDMTDLSYCNTEAFADVTLSFSDTAPFSDISGVTENARDVISKLWKKGVINGCGDGMFMPDRAASLEEFVSMTSRMFKIRGDSADNGAWFAGDAAGMKAAGYLTGISDDRFGKYTEVSKKELGEILDAILKSSGTDGAGYADDGGAASRSECAEAVYDAYKKLCHPVIKTEEREPYNKTLIKTASLKENGNANPLITQRFGADPFAMEYDGRVYIYMTGDNYRYDENGDVLGNDYSNVNTISVISSADMVNWTDHGEIAVGGRGNNTGAAKWAKNSWAPCAAHKTIDGREKFFLYFADAGGGIGVLESDSPTGPFTDTLGKALINGATPGCGGVVWLFDPAVLIDDDGSAYMYFGGGMPTVNGVTETEHPKTVRVIRLGGDMISTVGEALEIDAPAVFEDSGIHKYNGKYYYSYCSNFEGSHENGKYPFGTILYMTSDNPMGPFEYRGMILDNMYAFFGVGGNNHHAVFSFGDKWYITYHAQTAEKYLDDIKGYRTTHLNYLEYNSDGTIKPVTADFKGVEPTRSFDPFIETPAVTMARLSGVSTMNDGGGMAVCDINNGDWISVRNVDFKDGAESIETDAAVIDGGRIEIRLDAPDGALAGTVGINDGRSAAKLSEKITGVHDLYFVFAGNDGAELFKLKSWKFGK